MLIVATIVVAGSGDVSTDGMKQACYLTRFMFADWPSVRNAYFKLHGRVALIADTEQTTDIPEHSFLGKKPEKKAMWDSRARGLGLTLAAPCTSAGDDNQRCDGKDQRLVPSAENII